MAQSFQKPVAIICTSGTAALNFAPAIAEAYYQKIPLIVITADRPAYLLGQQDGQMMNQVDVYKNYIAKSVSLPLEPNTYESLEVSNSLVQIALQTAINNMQPVHINVPLEEPLYQQVEVRQDNSVLSPNIVLETTQNISIANVNEFQKVMLLVGSGNYENIDFDFSDFPQVVVLKDITANISAKTITLSEPLMHTIPIYQENELQPNLLITMGNGLVSKKIKQFLRQNKPINHWHVDVQGIAVDTFQCLEKTINASPKDFTAILKNTLEVKENATYKMLWQKQCNVLQEKNDKLLKDAPWNDWLVYDLLSKTMRNQNDFQFIHLANSTPVRHAAAFNWNSKFFANRGVSGIDGCTSTASGFAFAAQKNTLLITGEVAFMYDSNALWNQHLPACLKIIVINNDGGNIFRLINDEDSLPELNTYFEAPISVNIQSLCSAYQLSYYFCNRKEDFENVLNTFLNKNEKKCAVLEVKTNGKESAAWYKNFIKELK